MEEKRIYIAGKIGTYDIDKVSKETFGKFHNATKELKEIFPNCQVCNPLDYAKFLLEENLPLNVYTRCLKNKNIRTLTDSTAIYLLTDWRSSAGALFEKEVADFLGLEIIYQKERSNSDE